MITIKRVIVTVKQDESPVAAINKALSGFIGQIVYVGKLTVLRGIQPTTYTIEIWYQEKTLK